MEFCLSGRGDSCPERLRIYVNSPNGIDFGDDTKPTQEFSLYSAETTIEYPVRITAFSNVSTVTLFFVSPTFALSPHVLTNLFT